MKNFKFRLFMTEPPCYTKLLRVRGEEKASFFILSLKGGDKTRKQAVVLPFYVMGVFCDPFKITSYKIGEIEGNRLIIDSRKVRIYPVV